MQLQSISNLPISSSPFFSAINTISIPYQTAAFSSMSYTDSDYVASADQAVSIVAQALEAARDTPEGSQDPAVVRILETALAEIWRKIEARPTSYVMTRDEFAVFNYFQSRYTGQRLATAARKRYWDHLEIVN
ncbi:hypothetical protein WAI453_005840 [Rhynchosporium graminicola]|uniref:Uncharacterized protein n=1 Tax=Rhynchosporium graminicola TaxID=2792576 RepID=A0A1E1KK77_9HELO|nr:uncharacterized protein RCO7_04212 [Rhynchosporium commune]